MKQDGDLIKSPRGDKRKGTDELGVDGISYSIITPERIVVDEEPEKPGKRIKSIGKKKRSLREREVTKSNRNQMKLNRDIHLNEKNIIGIEKFHHVNDDAGMLLSFLFL